MFSSTKMNKAPVNYIISIDDPLLAEFFYWWIYCDKPCSIQVMKPKTEGITAIKMTVNSDETADFLLKVKSETGCKLYQK